MGTYGCPVSLTTRPGDCVLHYCDWSCIDERPESHMDLLKVQVRALSRTVAFDTDPLMHTIVLL